MYAATQKRIPINHLKQPNPTTTFMKLYKEDLHHLLETDDHPELYEAATLAQGEKYIKETFIRDGKGNQLSLFCSIKQFRKYGVGIYLLFLFLRSITLLYVLKSLIAIGSMVLMAYSRNSLVSRQNIFIVPTLGNMNPDEPRKTIWILDTLGSIFLMIFIILWDEFQQRIVVGCAQVAPLTSYYTAIISNLPQNFKQQNDLKPLIHRFGPVEQIYTVRDYVDYLFYYKLLINTLEKIKVQKAELELDQTRQKQKYYSLLEEFYIMYVKIKKLQDDVSSKPVFVFISFRTIFARQNMIRELIPQSWPCARNSIYNEINPKNLIVKRCYVQPSGILWQNIHITRCESLQKFIIQSSLVFLVLVIGIASILLCSLFQSTANIESDNSQQIVFCSSLNIFDLMRDQKCQKYQKQFIGKMLLSISIPVIIAVIKQLITLIINGLAYFRRFGTLIKLIRSKLLTYWLVYFVTTTLIVPLIHIKAGSFSFKKILQPIFKSLWPQVFTYRQIAIYNQFNITWYMNIGQSVVLTGFLSFGLGYVMDILINWLLRKFKNWRAKKERIQKQMNQKLKGIQIDIAFIYAQALTLVCFVQFYSVGLPILLLFGSLSLVMLYVSVKVNFLRFCRTPSIFNETINQIVIKILILALLLHNFMSPLILAGTDNIAPKHFFPRMWHYGSYIFISGAIIFYYLGRSYIVKILKKISGKFKHRRQRESSTLPNQINYIDRTFRDAQQISKNQLKSYRMDQNPKYKYMLKALYTLSGATAIMTAYNNDFWMSDSDQTIKNSAMVPQLSVTINPFFGVPSKKDINIMIDEVESRQQTEP